MALPNPGPDHDLCRGANTGGRRLNAETNIEAGLQLIEEEIGVGIELEKGTLTETKTEPKPASAECAEWA